MSVMSIEIVALAGSSAAGIISAAVIDKYSRKKVKKEEERPKTSSLNSAKAELSSLVFEKSLCSEAITRVYEASQKGKIDRLERDRLLLKYKQQLESINTRASQLQLVADYSDLTDVRNNLTSLLENRISAIDNKLLELSKRGLPHAVADTQLLKIANDITIPKKIESSLGDESQDENTQFFSAPEEKSIEQLQRDIMQALQRLEQVEVDKE